MAEEGCQLILGPDQSGGMQLGHRSERGKDGLPGCRGIQHDRTQERVKQRGETSKLSSFFFILYNFAYPKTEYCNDRPHPVHKFNDF